MGARQWGMMCRRGPIDNGSSLPSHGSYRLYPDSMGTKSSLTWKCTKVHLWAWEKQIIFLCYYYWFLTPWVTHCSLTCMKRNKQKWKLCLWVSHKQSFQSIRRSWIWKPVNDVGYVCFQLDIVFCLVFVCLCTVYICNCMVESGSLSLLLLVNAIHNTSCNVMYILFIPVIMCQICTNKCTCSYI